ncbi:MAG: hypothetical protein GYB66_01000 [Chloroflexi bacterium]|nr:hypothetical protein [Chloroflexota bacterium]
MLKLHHFAVILSVVGLMLLLPVIAQGQGGGEDDPVAPPDDVRLPLVELVYTADFTDEAAWPSGQTSDGSMGFNLTPEGYSIASLDPEGGIGVANPIDLVIDDFYAEIAFTVDTCNSPDSAFLFFTRFGSSTLDPDAPASYVFVIQCSGDYRSRGLDAGEILPVTVSGQTMALEEGQEVVMGVLFVGDQVVWFLNGEELESFAIGDAALPEGSLTAGAQLGFGYTVTDWRVWSLKSTGSAADTASQPTQSPPSDGDPLNQQGPGDIVYQPDFNPPTSLDYGLHNPVAAYISGDNLTLYNTEPLAVWPLRGLDASEYYLEVPIAVRDCEDTSSVGFAFNAADDYSSYFAYQVQCDGQYRVIRVEDGTVVEELASGETGMDLRDFSRGLVLGLYLQGDTAWLYLDNQLQGSFTDSRLAGGEAGLLLASGENSRRMDVLVFNIAAFDIR